MADYQVLFNIVVGLSGVLGGFILTGIQRSIDRLDKDVRNVPVLYATKAELQKAMDDVKDDMESGFDRMERNFGAVFRKLDNKEDKSFSVASRSGDKQ